MNKKVMSISVVVMTIITVYIMVCNSKYSDNGQLNYSSLKNDKTINENSNKKEDKNIVPNGTMNSGDIVKNNTTSSENNVKKNVENNVNSIAQKQSGNSAIDNKENTIDDTKNNSVDIENNKPIFKISKDKIIDTLSFTDKAKILLISKSLSPTDFSKLQDDVNSDDEKKGIVSAMNLLKRRLDDKDYSKLKSIASKFINLDALNY